jgi:hypothetical protein
MAGLGSPESQDEAYAGQDGRARSACVLWSTVLYARLIAIHENIPCLLLTLMYGACLWAVRGLYMDAHSK